MKIKIFKPIMVVVRYYGTFNTKLEYDFKVYFTVRTKGDNNFVDLVYMARFDMI